MRRKVLVGILLVCLVLEAIPVTTIAQPSPPIEFEGMIQDKDITISKTEGGYKIGLCNNLWWSELDVFFDGVYQGKIPDGPSWKYFQVTHKVNHVIVSAAEGSYDEGRAWHRYLSEEDWPDTTPTPIPECRLLGLIVPNKLNNGEKFDKKISNINNIKHNNPLNKYKSEFNERRGDKYEGAVYTRGTRVDCFFYEEQYKPMIYYDCFKWNPSLRSYFYFIPYVGEPVYREILKTDIPVPNYPPRYYKDSGEYIVFFPLIKNPRGFTGRQGYFITITADNLNVAREITEKIYNQKENQIELGYTILGRGSKARIPPKPTVTGSCIVIEGEEVKIEYVKGNHEYVSDSARVFKDATVIIKSDQDIVDTIFSKFVGVCAGEMIPGFSMMERLEKSAEKMSGVTKDELKKIKSSTTIRFHPKRAEFGYYYYYDENGKLHLYNEWWNNKKKDLRPFIIYLIRGGVMENGNLAYNILTANVGIEIEEGELGVDPSGVITSLVIDVATEGGNKEQIRLRPWGADGDGHAEITIKDGSCIIMLQSGWDRPIIFEQSIEVKDSEIIENTLKEEKPAPNLQKIFHEYLDAIISTLNEMVITLKEKTISVPPEEKAKEKVEEDLSALSSIVGAYSEWMKMIYEISGVEPPEGTEMEFRYRILGAKFCKTVEEARDYMSSNGIKSTEMNDALDLVKELELEKEGFCIVIVGYSFTGFGEYESGRYPIVCNEKGDPFWECWQFYENIKKKIEEAYKEYE